ncbi:MAG: bifunctional metallophosphatase/5'-nucleotidase [Chitinophagaceae bacterium]|nr:bifunctional metallophosphatase/5'-nucleotidase [Rubrivivax sp.]
MFKISSIARAAAVGVAALSTVLAAHAAPVSVKIVGFNDYHGQLESPGTFGQNLGVPAANRPAVGGAEYLQAYVARLRAVNPNTVVVGAGDFIGATPLISALFYDEPSVETLNKIGVDFSAVGNHEFDKGKDELRRLQNGGCKITNGAPDPNSCKGFGSAAPGSFDGARFKWLSANVIEDATGKTLLPAYGVKSFPVPGSRTKVNVAFIGMTLKGTPTIVTPTGVAGLTFADESTTVNALIPRLRRAGIESIVVLVHQGGFQGSGNNGDINGCVGNLTGSDIAGIVSRLDDAVDLVISGHTHSAYNCSGQTNDNGAGTIRDAGLPNSVGRKIPMTSSSAFGRVLTEVNLSIDSDTRDVTAVNANNALVARNNPVNASDPVIAAVNGYITANPELQNIVAAYRLAQAPLAGAVLATITAALPNSANTAGEMEAGDLIADAQLQATQPAGLGGAQFAFMNAGGVRNPGFVNTASPPVYPYDVTYSNAFTAQPFGNSLVTMTLTTQQIKDVLEQQFANCNTTQTGNRIMQISNGFKYTWNSAGSCGTRITDVSFTPTDLVTNPAVPTVTAPTENLVIAGVVQDPTKTYRVTVNNFIATGGDGFTVFTGGLNSLGGAQDIDALVAYLVAFKAPAAPYNPTNPALSKPRITRQ